MLIKQNQSHIRGMGLPISRTPLLTEIWSWESDWSWSHLVRPAQWGNVPGDGRTRQRGLWAQSTRGESCGRACRSVCGGEVCGRSRTRRRDRACTPGCGGAPWEGRGGPWCPTVTTSPRTARSWGSRRGHPEQSDWRWRVYTPSTACSAPAGHFSPAGSWTCGCHFGPGRYWLWSLLGKELRTSSQVYEEIARYNNPEKSRRYCHCPCQPMRHFLLSLTVQTHHRYRGSACPHRPCPALSATVESRGPRGSRSADSWTTFSTTDITRAGQAVRVQAEWVEDQDESEEVSDVEERLHQDVSPGGRGHCHRSSPTACILSASQLYSNMLRNISGYRIVQSDNERCCVLLVQMDI